MVVQMGFSRTVGIVSVTTITTVYLPINFLKSFLRTNSFANIHFIFDLQLKR